MMMLTVTIMDHGDGVEIDDAAADDHDGGDDGCCLLFPDYLISPNHHISKVGKRSALSLRFKRHRPCRRRSSTQRCPVARLPLHPRPADARDAAET